ncbi:MAG: polysaccharide pyruvyl transferase family protein [Bacteroides sp.]|uniref:polysaccharide pyruvyl transferase family protein n=1 Tax=Bacteroides sp. TaxID=29523 RepID=UPI0026DECBCE|nr:polysaccharide pyruvyl transferase family protein [Bacteroides sp.]MDO5420578.1 polysaccharide pyruvyl transferase family protein [Bacteroides sp.]
MKIGIITIHKSTVNYGACLQCYALWKYLTDKGHQCEIIDLLRPIHKGYIYTSKDKISLSCRLKAGIKRILDLPADYRLSERTKLIENFNKQISYSKTYRNPKELCQNPPDYDAYISGSDQIWNPYMPFNNEPYLLSFVPKGKKKIAYASSFAVESIPLAHKETYAKLLAQYDSLSTREQSGKQIIHDLIRKDTPVVLDPTFLISSQKWIEMTNNMCPISAGYILAYCLNANPILMEHVKEIARLTNLKIILIIADKQIIHDKHIRQLTDVAPLEWLGIIRNAQLVITSSFHGTVFAMQFGTPFFTYISPKNKTNDRIITLLKRFNLESHIITNESSFIKNKIMENASFNYDTFKELLDMKVRQSQQYLIDALK